MRIAVVIPTFDRPDQLDEALISVAQQSRVPDEVHVVLDAGPPLTLLENRFRNRLVLQVHRLAENRGQAAARNHGLARIESDAVAFLDDDDRFLPHHLERLERALRQDPSLVLVYDDCEIRRETGCRRISLDYDPGLVRRYDYVPPSSWLARSDAIARAGGFDESLRCYEDWDLLLRLEAWGGIRRVPGVGARIRIGSSSQSLRVDERRRCALERLRAEHGLEAIDPLTFWEVAEAVSD